MRVVWADATRGWRPVSIEGPAGIGKSALTRAFMAESGTRHVLAVSGVEAECDLAFATIDQLARQPAVAGRPAAAGLSDLGPGSDPLITGRTLLDLLGTMEDDDPLLLVVDDLHWVDPQSARALLFALRRLSSERIMAIITSRPEETAGWESGWQKLFDFYPARRVRLEGLTVDELRTLIAKVHGVKPSQQAVWRLWDHTQGSPLYARYLLDEISPEQLETSDRLPAPRSLASLVLGRLASCSAPARNLVIAAAVLGERCPLADAAELGEVIEPGRAFTEAVAAGLLADGSDALVGFPHPLTRAAVYHDLNTVQRSELHRKAVSLSAGASALSHRLSAATGSATVDSEQLLSELDGHAGKEVESGRFDSAALWLARGARVAPDEEERSFRLLSAFGLWIASGDVACVERRRPELEALPSSPQKRYILGTLEMFAGKGARVRDGLIEAWTEMESSGQDLDPWAAGIATTLAVVALFKQDCDDAMRWLSQAERIAPSPMSRLLRCVALGAAGLGEQGLSEVGPAAPATMVASGRLGELYGRGILRLFTDDWAAARDDLKVAIASSRDTSHAPMVPQGLVFLSGAHYVLGELDEAIVHAELALSWSREPGLATVEPLAAAYLTWPLAARGDLERAAAQAQLASRLAEESLTQEAYAAIARWSVAVASNDGPAMNEAAAGFQATNPAPELGVFPFGPILAEARLTARDADGAEEALSVYEEAARASGRRSALMMASRVRGQLEARRGDQRAEVAALEAGLDHAAGLGMVLEQARLQAVLAGLLRGPEAEQHREAARRAFESIGAFGYLARMDTPAGATPGPRGPVRRNRLTATEAMVARLVASGEPNKSVADSLMVSRKAVEHHLTNIYAKLGITSRTQLAAQYDRLVRTEGQ